MGRWASTSEIRGYCLGFIEARGHLVDEPEVALVGGEIRTGPTADEAARDEDVRWRERRRSSKKRGKRRRNTRKA